MRIILRNSKGAKLNTSGKHDDFSTHPLLRLNGINIKEYESEEKLEETYDKNYYLLLLLANHPQLKDIIWKKYSLRGVPLLEPYKPYTYQNDVMKWMTHRESLDPKTTHGVRGGILHLSMGLGKTLICLLHALSAPRGEFPTLIIASKSILNELKKYGVEKFFGYRIKVLYLHSDYESMYGYGKKFCRLGREDVVKYDAVMTTYDVCSSTYKSGISNCEDKGLYGDTFTLLHGNMIGVDEITLVDCDRPELKGYHTLFGSAWERIVCDESQRITNYKSLVFQAIMNIYGRYKWCLTGTPIKNKSTDLWAQLRFCGYTGIKNASVWEKNFMLYKAHSLNEAVYSLDYEKAGVELPTKHSHTVTVKLSDDEKVVYNELLSHTKSSLRMITNKKYYTEILALFSHLRKTTVSPYLVKSYFEERLQEHPSDKNLREIKKLCMEPKSSKMKSILNVLCTIPKSDKAIVFSSFVSGLNLLSEILDGEDITYVKITGDDSKKEREELLDDFRSNHSIKVLLMSTKVGSEGLNIVEANHVLFIEPWWSPVVHAQAEARCHRIGQLKEVHTYNFITEDAIEEKIRTMHDQKVELSKKYTDPVFDKGVLGNKNTTTIDKITLMKILS